MADGWGFAMQGAVNGFLRGKNYLEDQEDRQFQKEQRDRQRKEQADADALKADLRQAGRQVAVEQIGGRAQIPDWADNRDSGTPEMQALPNSGLTTTPIALQVQGKTYGSRPEADAAAAQANTPMAMAQRTADVYRRHGAVDKAMAVESSEQQARAARLQLANQEFRQGLGKAMLGGHEALAQFATSTEAGHLSGIQAKAIPSPDGKSVTYATIDKDGTATPIQGLTFSNDREGITQAAFLLDRLVDPAARVQLQEQQAQRKQAQSNTDRAFAEGVRQFDRTDARLTSSQAQDEKLRGLHIEKAKLDLEEATRNAKINPADRMRAEGIRKEMETLGAAMVKAQAEGNWQPDSLGAKELMGRQGTLRRQLEDILAPYQQGGQRRAAFGGPPGSAAPGQPISFNDPMWDRAEADAAAKTGVPPEVLRVVRTVGERSNGDQVSPKGARGVYQFIPSSRDSVKQKYGADAYSDDPAQQALAAAYHLKESFDRTKSWEKAVAGFNGGISAEKGTNTSAENRAYVQRTAPAIAAQVHQRDPMEQLYQRQVAEMNRGTRADLSSDVRDWLARRDDDKKQQFNAAQAAYLQKEKDRALRESKVLAANSRP